jgi:hypothetical protein
MVSHRLFADQVYKQYEHTGFGTAATLINGMILVFVLRGHVRSLDLLIWLAVAVMVSASRLMLYGAYRKSPTQTSNPHKWNAWFLGSLFFSDGKGMARIGLTPGRAAGNLEMSSLIDRHSNVHMSTRLQSDLFNVYGSSAHIYKSVSNLIGNAIEAMPKGGCIEIATGNRYADSLVAGFDTVREGEYVVLSIADSGVGILEGDRVRIFEPFYTKKIMDPGIDGYEAFRQIRSIHPEQRAVIASGYSETDRVRDAQALGAGSYIKKPYTMAAIGKAVKDALQRQPTGPAE